MPLPSWLRTFFSPRRRRPHRLNQTRLNVQILEDRCTPSITLTNPGTLSSYDGDVVSRAMTYTDSGNSPNFSASNLPSGLSINMSTGVITGTVGGWAHTMAPYTTSVTIMDMGTMESANQSFTWNVSQPTVTNPGTHYNFDLDSVSFAASATDSAGHALTYSATNLPSGMTVNSSTGVISGTMNSMAHTMDPYSVTVTATDYAANVNDSKGFTWNVGEYNHAPSFTASNPPASNEGAGAVSISSWASFSAGASNESWQTATYIVSNVSDPEVFLDLPAVAPNGTLTYTVAPNLRGTFTFDLQVQDNGGSNISAASTVTITVNPLVYLASTHFFGDQDDVATITVCLTGESALDVTVDYATGDGSAEAGTDYTGTTGTLTIPAGYTSASFSIAILDDASTENWDEFTITLSNPSHAGLGSLVEADAAIFVGLAENESPVASLNAISGEITALLAGIDGLSTQANTGINAGLTTMDTQR
ncbi:MAG: hypothetical protein EXR98_07320 [Gemmataceae bacterium]|nr:hypothetical protein [Gemmataceae bacterium]